MLRVRFKVPFPQDGSAPDYRPMVWPIKHPYWCSGEGDGYFTMVAYVEDEEELMTNWPDAEELDVMDDDASITFSGRFPKPDWYNP